VADILYWLAQKYDPQSDISDDINEEKDRVEFMRTVVNLFAVKARIKLNAKKLYQADSEAVAEILKITSVLYKVLPPPRRLPPRRPLRRSRLPPSPCPPRSPTSSSTSNSPTRSASWARDSTTRCHGSPSCERCVCRRWTSWTA
jgi:hypothetical protein